MDMAAADDASEQGDLTEDQCSLFYFFYDSRNRKGVPTATVQKAAAHFNWKWAKTSALMDEIADAGFWQRRPEGHPVFDPDRIPPRPQPLWAEPSDPSARRLTPDGAHPAGVGARNYPTAIRLEETTKRNPFGVSPSAGRMELRTVKREVIDLTDYFAYKVRKAYGGFAPDPINNDAIRANFRRWIGKDGIPPGVIKAMIDVFVGQRLERDSTKPEGRAPVWKVFLAQRQRLLNAVENQTRTQRISHYWQQKIEEADGE